MEYASEPLILQIYENNEDMKLYRPAFKAFKQLIYQFLLELATFKNLHFITAVSRFYNFVEASFEIRSGTLIAAKDKSISQDFKELSFTFLT